MTQTTKKKTCFVISPIGDKGSDVRKHADMVLNSIIRPALPDYQVHRADELGDSAMITDKMIEAILESDLAIADLTGENPNVFYEVGLRHMAEKPIIHLSSTTNLPFDNACVSTIFFDPKDWYSHQSAIADIKQRVEKLSEKGYKVSNPVTQARGSMKLAQSADSRDQVIFQMSERLSQLERKVDVVATEPRGPFVLAPGKGFDPPMRVSASSILDGSADAGTYLRMFELAQKDAPRTVWARLREEGEG